MFMMFQQNYNFCGCSPFMTGGFSPFMFGNFNPRMNFFMGLAADTAGLQNPMFSMYQQMPVFNSYSIFQPNFAMNCANPAFFSGYGTTYQPQAFNFPQLNITAPIAGTLTAAGPYKKKETPQTKENTSQTEKNKILKKDEIDDNAISTQGMVLKNKGKGTQYGPEFLNRVKQIAKNLNCNYRDLLAIMNSESGINAKTVAKNGASGLICFVPQYYDVEKIRKMSPMEQLDLVEKTLQKSKVSRGFAADEKLSKGDLYALVFLPAKAKRDVLCTKGERDKNGRLLGYYESNSALDYNRDGKITKDEMATRIDKKYVSDTTFLA